MKIEYTTRGFISAFFRQRHTFLAIFLLISLSAAAYVVIAKPLYEAGGSLLVKFGASPGSEIARPENNSPTIISQNDRRELMQSNMDILLSHNLLLTAVKQIGAEKLYPGITEKVAGKDLPEEAAVRQLWKGDLNVKSAAQSNVIDVLVMNEDPRVAVQFINSLFALYIARQSEVFNKPQTDFLEDQVRQASAKLEFSQQKLKDFKEKNGISSIESELDQLLQQKGEAGTISLDTMDDAWAKLADLEAKEAQMLTTYQPGSPQVRRIHNSVELAREQLRQRQGDLASRTGKARKNIDVRIAQLESQRNTYNDLARQVEIDEENYKNFKLRSEQARVNETLNQKSITPISVLDEPVVPMKPVRPRKLLVLALGLLAGVVFGCGAALALETLDPRFTTPEQVSLALGVPVLASFSG